ncbi:MAG TPA: peptidylprolyl isomerase, partial [Lacipirellulaceae bacterium]
TPINLKVAAGSEQNSYAARQQVKGMFLRFIAAFVLCAIVLPSSATAQVVRFETTMGDFDMVLNPTNDPRLEGHVDNMLQYVEGNYYRSSWINRADGTFVLQMGGFYAHTRRPPLTVASTRPIPAFDPVEGEPGIAGLSNTVGTVSMALPGGAGGTNQDGGTSSFFINLGDNSQLDTDFTVFAAIPDMTVVNQIMALMKLDRTTEPQFGAGPGNLAFTDVPVQANGQQVFIRRAFVVEDSMTIARAMGGVESIIAQSAASVASESGAPLASNGTAQLASADVTVVPEPAAALLAALGISGVALRAPRARRS